MASTTPAAAPTPQDRSDDTAARPGEVPMRALLASCASAAAVSTPPARPRPAAQDHPEPTAPPRAA
ncbi:hypothetical protein [Kitasatospora sp. DSM 101779]|uniref:hypothetical protein n=1 Tax=Kitasatospora sp. DSM 101779 TaxID=2853165 RepID=UPI0021D7D81F|nr:hypothetical protein [Kitasatospora sp. DSM 101779]MCU7824333.1 hypothetical protein [Kitasatospora sp. DSM 101779]